MAWSHHPPLIAGAIFPNQYTQLNSTQVY